jgi:2,3-bisphosphoglycerate-independent phosphoglycerate mutase
MNTPVVLIIMDGWGISPNTSGNAISLAGVKTIPRLTATYPHTTLAASGMDVGLPAGENGNTETGHINIGAGRIVFQDMVKIDHAIADGSFARNEAILGAIKHAQTHGSNLHIMGLFSDAGVHASRQHLCAILETCKNMQLPHVYLHLFTDGRDAPPSSALSFFRDYHSRCSSFPFAKIASVIGRYYAMDRDKRWERTETAYKALTEGSQYTAKNVDDAISYAYTRGETDEFIKPTVILDENGTPYPRINDNDAVIFFNYRIDRPRQLTRAFILKKVKHPFPLIPTPSNI